MKIRNGFVSNSSTSSFIIAGFDATEEELQKMVEQSDVRVGELQLEYDCDLQMIYTTLGSFEYSEEIDLLKMIEDVNKMKLAFPDKEIKTYGTINCNY